MHVDDAKPTNEMPDTQKDLSTGEISSVCGGGGADTSGGGGRCQSGILWRRPAAHPTYIALIMNRYYSDTFKKPSKIGKI